MQCLQAICHVKNDIIFLSSFQIRHVQNDENSALFSTTNQKWTNVLGLREATECKISVPQTTQLFLDFNMGANPSPVSLSVLLCRTTMGRSLFGPLLDSFQSGFDQHFPAHSSGHTFLIACILHKYWSFCTDTDSLNTKAVLL